MSAKHPEKRHTHPDLGKFLRDARSKLRDKDTGRSLRVKDMALLLGVTASFVYQVEQGNRKPNNGDFGRWASVYGVRYIDLWKCVGRIPMDLVATLKEEPQHVSADPFSQLTKDEKTELLPFLDFVQWKLANRASQSKSSR